MRRTPPRNRFVTSIQSLACGFGFTLLPATAVLISPSATAQVSEVTPYYAQVTVEHAYLRCGDGEPWYAVGRVPQGTLLLVDGEGFGWLRVSYPDSVGALIRTDEATLQDSGEQVRLTRPSALRAYNINGGVNNSWKRLLSDRIVTGTHLAVLETIMGPENTVEGYIVSPPDNARAFISQELVTRLTTEQAAARLKTLPQIAATNTPSLTPEISTPELPVDAPTTTPADTLATTNSVPSTPPQAPATTPTTTTTPQPTAYSLDPTSDAVGQRLLTLTELHEAFQRVFQVPIAQAELQPLIDEHTAVLSDLTADPDDQSSRRFIESQIQLLEIRLEVQSRLDQISDVSSAANQERALFEANLTKFQENPDYNVVGRLTTSAIYDGTTLPRLYRLLSVEDGSNRTIGYLAPNPDFDLDSKIGLIIGIVGSERQRNTGAIRASVLTATRIDVLQP